MRSHAQKTLRSASYPRGLPREFSERERERIEVGNRMLDSTIHLISVCHRHSIPFCLEQPKTSYMWHDRRLQQVLRSSHAVFFKVDQCRFGTRWRKPTMFAFSLAKPISNPGALRCHGKHGWCSFRPDHKHVILDGSSLTRAAAAYPPRMAHWIVNQLL